MGRSSLVASHSDAYLDQNQPHNREADNHEQSGSGYGCLTNKGIQWHKHQHQDPDIPDRFGPQFVSLRVRHKDSLVRQSETKCKSHCGTNDV